MQNYKIKKTLHEKRLKNPCGENCGGFLFWAKRGVAINTPELKEGYLYFIKPEYFDKYDIEKKLMTDMNNRNGDTRPHMFSHRDKKSNIAYFIPCSKQDEKHSKLIERRKNAGKKTHSVRVVEIEGVDRAVLIGHMIPVPDEYISGKRLKNEVHLKIDDDSDIATIVKSSKQMTNLRRKHANIGLNAADLNGLEHRAKVETECFDIFRKHQLVALENPDKLLLYQTDREFILLGDDAVQASALLGKTTHEIPTGVGIADKVSCFRVKNSDIYNLIDVLKQNNLEFAERRSDGSVVQYEAEKREINAIKEKANELLGEEQKETQVKQSNGMAHNTPPEKEASIVSEELKSKLQRREDVENAHRQIDMPDGNSIICWLTKDAVYELEVATELLNDPTKNYRRPENETDGQEIGAVEVAKEHLYGIDQLERLGIELDKIKEIPVIHIMTESKAFEAKDAAKPYAEWTRKEEPEPQHHRPHAEQNTPSTKTPENTEDLVYKAPLEEGDKTSEAKSKFSVMETDDGKLYLVLHEKECDYIIDYSNNPENMVDAIQNLRRGQDIIEQRFTPEELENLPSFQIPSDASLVADQDHINMLNCIDKDKARKAFDFGWEGHSKEKITEHVTQMHGNEGKIDWDTYFQNYKDRGERKLETEVEIEASPEQKRESRATSDELSNAEPDKSGRPENPIQPEFSSIHENKDVKELVAIMEENGKDPAIIKELLGQVGELEAKIAAQTSLLEKMNEQLRDMKELQEASPGRKAIEEFASVISKSVEATKQVCLDMKDAITEGCKSAVQAFKNEGIKVLDNVLKFINVKESLSMSCKGLEKEIAACDKAKDAINKFANDYHKVGASVKNVGIALQNVGRTILGREPKEPAEVKEAGKLAKAITAPIEAFKANDQKLLKSCNSIIRQVADIEARATAIKEHQAEPKKSKPSLQAKRESASKKLDMANKSKDKDAINKNNDKGER